MPGTVPNDVSVSVVIPVYHGARTLPDLVAAFVPFASGFEVGGRGFRLIEVVLVYDWGSDRSDETIRELAARFPFVRPVWLTRNFGQHAATLAGMAASAGDWVVTMDEDGQHEPAAMPSLLAAALAERAQVAYAHPIGGGPHGALRNSASRNAKRVTARLFAGSRARDFSSYRAMQGEIARTTASLAVTSVYLDVALGWVAGRYAVVSVPMGEEGRESGYSGRRLFSHFWRLVVSSGTRALRIVSAVGIAFAVIGIALVVVIIVTKLMFGIDAEGWASTITAILISSGAILFSLGVIAEYIGVTVGAAMGRPPYVVASDPAFAPGLDTINGPAGRADSP